jgi:hypothetical protein
MNAIKYIALITWALLMATGIIWLCCTNNWDYPRPAARTHTYRHIHNRTSIPVGKYYTIPGKQLVRQYLFPVYCSCNKQYYPQINETAQPLAGMKVIPTTTSATICSAASIAPPAYALHNASKQLCCSGRQHICCVCQQPGKNRVEPAATFPSIPPGYVCFAPARAGYNLPACTN